MPKAKDTQDTRKAWRMAVGLLAVAVNVALMAGTEGPTTVAEAASLARASAAGERLVRVVDLPDVPALHWRGGRYKDLGYLLDRNGGGSWVAYLGPGQYIPLTQRELERMIRMMADMQRRRQPNDTVAAAAPATPAGPSAAGEHGVAGEAGKTDRQAANGARTVSAPGKSALARDDLDMALLQQDAEAALVTGSTDRAPEIASSAQSAISPIDETAPAMPSAGKADMPAGPDLAPGRNDVRIKTGRPDVGESGMSFWNWLSAGGLVLAGAAVAGLWIYRRRKSSSESLRERMHHVMKSQPTPAPMPADAMDAKASAGRTSARGAASGAVAAAGRRQGDAASADPAAALQAMQAAARGGLTS